MALHWTFRFSNQLMPALHGLRTCGWIIDLARFDPASLMTAKRLLLTTAAVSHAWSLLLKLQYAFRQRIDNPDQHVPSDVSPMQSLKRADDIRGFVNAVRLRNPGLRAFRV